MSLASACADLASAVGALQARYAPAPADGPVAPEVPSVYGPGETDWPDHTPGPDEPVTVTVPPNVAAIEAALQDAGADMVVIGVTDGVLSGDIGAVASMAARTSRVLIRPMRPFGVQISGQMRNSCSGTCLAMFDAPSGIYLCGAADQALARIAIGPTGNLSVNGTDGVEIVDCAKPGRGALASGDAADLKSPNSGANLPARNVSIRGLWLEGIALAPGGSGHNDTIQILAEGGANEIKRSYLGQGGNSTTVLHKLDFQATNAYADWLIEDVYAAPCDGSDDVLWYVYGGGSLTMRRVVSEGTIHLRLGNSATWQPGSPVTFDQVCGAALAWIGSDGKGHQDNQLIPGFTAAVPARPVFTPPSWWPVS